MIRLDRDDHADRQTTAAGSPALQLLAACRVHGRGATAVAAVGPVTLEIRRGEFVAIMGPSGSGKSTLLSLAGAIDRPSSGRVVVFGQDLTDLSLTQLATLRRQAIGYVFQDLNLLPGLTALENVALPLELDGTRSSEARRQATQALDAVKLAHLARRLPDDLSGGEQQRVAIARALVGPRGLLLADEPTGALDSVTAEVVMRLLRSQCDRGQTALLVTHDAVHAAFADRILFLRDGLLVDDPRAAILPPRAGYPA